MTDEKSCPMFAAILRGRNGSIVAVAGSTVRYLRAEAKRAAMEWFGEDWTRAIKMGWRVERVAISSRPAKARK